MFTNLPAIHEITHPVDPIQPYVTESTNILQQHIVDHTVELTLTDNRVYRGIVYCIDGKHNLILDKVIWLHTINHITQSIHVPHCLFALKYIKSIQLISDTIEQKQHVETVIQQYNTLTATT